VPKEYLSKALQALSQARIVASTLGPSGGYRLARPPAAITFLDIVEAVEGKASTFACTQIRQNNPCRAADHCDKGPCAIARVMWAADRAWRATLAGVDLAGLGATLERDLPSELRASTQQWVIART
jgi:Rrf2 family protein